MLMYYKYDKFSMYKAMGSSAKNEENVNFFSGAHNVPFGCFVGRSVGRLVGSFIRSFSRSFICSSVSIGRA